MEALTMHGIRRGITASLKKMRWKFCDARVESNLRPCSIQRARQSSAPNTNHSRARDKDDHPARPGLGNLATSQPTLLLRKRARLPAQLPLSSVLQFSRQERPDRNRIHTSPLETVDRFFRFADDRFVFVEAGIKKDRDARLSLECADQVVVKRVLVPGHALQSSSIIHVIDRAQLLPLFRTNFVHVQHEWRRMVVLEIVRLPLL